MTRNRRSTWLVVAMLACGGAACSSGPGPIDRKPYDAELQAFRSRKDAAFRTSDDSPIPAEQRAAFPGLAYFPIDPGARVPAYLTEDKTGPPLIMQLETSKGQHDSFRRVGSLGFTLGAAPYKLTAFVSVNASTMDRLFVPFGDLTNKNETYGGGRYVDLDRTATGLYDLDFNRAYHPNCVFNHEWECPVPPRENRLPVAIRAGERLRQ
jgi:uncharacterized protein (DUF1684 family)